MLEDRHTWVDPATPETIAAVYVSVTQLPAGMCSYFLLDAAFVPGLPRWLAQRWGDDEFCSLYAGRYTGDGIEAIAPYLVRLPEQVERRDALYANLMALAKGKPILNCLVTELPLVRLAAHLQRQLESVDAEGTAFLLRFADTRSLANLMAVLHPAQKRRMVAGIGRWMYADRQGGLRIVETDALQNTGFSRQNLPGGNPTEASVTPEENTDTSPYVIDAEQDRLLDRLGLPDAILRFAQLRESVMGVLTVSPSAAHAVIDEAARRLARHGIEDEASAYRCALTLLRRRGCFARPVAAFQ